MKYTSEELDIKKALEKRDNFKNMKIQQDAIDNINLANKKKQDIYSKRIRERELKRRERMKHDAIKKRILAIVLVATSLTSAAVAARNDSKDRADKTSIIVTSNTNDLVNEKIKNYQLLMNLSGDFAIQSFNERDENYEPLVYHTDKNIKNLVHILMEAAKTSEIEFRCAFLAAYKEINEPYRKEILNKGLIAASILQENSEFIFDIPGSLDELMDCLNYSDINEYNKEERGNIKIILESKNVLNIKEEGVSPNAR